VRLERIHEAIQRRLDAGAISGAVTLVARRGRLVHFQAHGLMDIESKRSMQNSPSATCSHTNGLMTGGIGSKAGPPRPAEGDTLANYIPRLAAVPLDFQPVLLTTAAPAW
jgi:hypothetical protein